MTGSGEDASGPGGSLRFPPDWSTAAWWAVGLVGVHVVLGLLLYEPVLFTGGDNAGYMILGDAVRSGAGYRDLYRPEAPLHTKYPPGYPALLALVGLFGGLQTFKIVALACSAAAVGLISVWWADPRFLLPIFPLLAVYVLLGARTAAGALSTGRSTPGLAELGTAALLVLPGLVSAGKLVPLRVECQAGYRAGQPCLPDRWISFHAAAGWARHRLPEGAVVANRKPRIFYWLSGHRGDVYAFSRDHDDVIRGLVEMGADYVVVDPLSRSAASYLVPAVRSRPDRFGQVYSEGEPPTTILRFARQRRPRDDRTD